METTGQSGAPSPTSAAPAMGSLALWQLQGRRWEVQSSQSSGNNSAVEIKPPESWGWADGDVPVAFGTLRDLVLVPFLHELGISGHVQ